MVQTHSVFLVFVFGDKKTRADVRRKEEPHSQAAKMPYGAMHVLTASKSTS